MNKSDTIRLTPKQTEVLKAWRVYPNEMCMTLLEGYWLTGGHGISIPKNTYRALKKMELVGFDNKLTDLGKNIKL